MKAYYLTALTMAALPAAAVQDTSIAPPKLQMIDDMGVNMATGQVVQRLQTVSIGGDLGLTHAITIHANHFETSLGHGQLDQFAGSAHDKRVLPDGDFRNDGFNTLQAYFGNQVKLPVRAMRVFSPAGTQEFRIISHDQGQYVAIGDQRHKLFVRTENGSRMFIWRTPEGVESRYWRDINDGRGGGNLHSITYPNGFRITVDNGAVTTNTGYMLKYNFPTSGDWTTNPTSVVGFNLAYDYCSPDVSTRCSTSGWPQASFHWPSSPGTSFLQATSTPLIFAVTDQFGGRTEYHYKSEDICALDDPITGQRGSPNASCTNGKSARERYSPRLVKVKSAASQSADFEFSYANDSVGYSTVSSPGLNVGLEVTYWDAAGISGRIKSVKFQNKTRSYLKPRRASGYPSAYTAYTREAQNTVTWLENFPGNVDHAYFVKSGSYKFEENARNFVVGHTDTMGVNKAYRYDARGNLTKVLAGIAPADSDANGVLLQEAGYSASCPESLFRQCNKPEWTRDGNGHQTDYTYHPESGQIKSITKPAVTIGSATVRPSVQYHYSQYYAYFKRSSNTVERAETPLWLLSSEHTCRTSATTADGCAAGDSDRILTRYYYGPQNGSANNLLLRGTSVTAESRAGQLETRVTCYAYDRLGNQIAQTSPKGASALESCP